MAKVDKPKVKVRVHQCAWFNASTGIWETACGLELDKKERADVTLAEDWKYVTCKECKKHKPEEEDDDG